MDGKDDSSSPLSTLDLDVLSSLCGTEASSDDQDETVAAMPTSANNDHRPHLHEARGHSKLPHHPSQWPQYPIVLTPTPGSGMVIHGVRYAESTEYNVPAWHAPRSSAANGMPHEAQEGCCCYMLPVNNGYEKPGKSLVIDFESPLFIGTLLMRVAGASVVESNDTADIANMSSYFDGKQRQFQVVIQGRFRRDDIPCSECVTGQLFDRPAGPMPAKPIVQAAVKLISTLAPQLEINLNDGTPPHFLTPLVATAQTVLVRPVDALSSDAEFVGNGTDMEADLQEPHYTHPQSVLYGAAAVPTNGVKNKKEQSTVEQRRARRKRAYNHIAATRATEPVFDSRQVYTFEFYQHMLSLTQVDDLKLSVATGFGRFWHIGLAKPLNGQPIRILSVQRQGPAHESTSKSKKDKAPTSSPVSTTVLWSFDIWHQALYPSALRDGSA